MRVAAALLTIGLLAGCGRSTHTPALSWDFEARLTDGEVRVLPVVVDGELSALHVDSWLGAPLPLERLGTRWARTEALSRVPDAVGLALPAAVHAELGSRWSGEFRVGSYPLGGRERLLTALRGRAPLEATLSELGRSTDGSSTLIVWVRDLQGVPLTSETMDGEIVQTAVGPVIVDHATEPYRVTVDLGMALVAPDGEVVLRYADGFEAVLSERTPADRVGRDLARALAHEVARVWPCDPRLAVAEPSPLLP